MRVVPEGVRTFVLIINKGVRWIPVLNRGLPTNRDLVNFECVIDHRSRLHLDRLRGEHLESKERRGKTLKIECIGEKRKHFLDRSRERLDRVDAPDLAMLRVDIGTDGDGTCVVHIHLFVSEQPLDAPADFMLV